MANRPIHPDLILNHIMDGLLLIDLDGRILWANSAFRKIVGLGEDEDLSSMSCCDLGLGSFCDIHCPVKKNKAGKVSTVEAHFNVEIQPDSGKGEPGAYCFITTPMQDADGKLIGFMENFRGMDKVRDVIMDL